MKIIRERSKLADPQIGFALNGRNFVAYDETTDGIEKQEMKCLILKRDFPWR